MTPADGPGIAQARDVVVVGGGIAGLAALYELHQRGIQATLLESSPRLGGVIRTDRADGWVIDGGPDSLLVQKPAAVALCRELGLGDELQPIKPPRTAFVLRGGRLHPLAEGSFLGFPLSLRGLARSSLFTPLGKVRMAAEVLVPPRRAEGDESIGAFVRRRFGREAADYLAEPLLAGIHAGDVDQLSVRTLFPRLSEAEAQAGSVLRALRRLRPQASPQGAFLSLRGGVGALVDALAAAVPAEAIRTDTPALSVHRDRGYRVAAPPGTWHARAVILALPGYAASRVTAHLDPSLGAALDALPYASTATIALGYRAAAVAHPLAGTGFVVPRVEGRALLAGTWVTSKWAGRAPDGHVLVRGFLGGGRDPQRLEQTDDALVADARGEIEALLGISAPPVLTRVYRFPRQSPQYVVGHLDRVSAIQGMLARHPGLFLTGSGFRAIGIPDNVADARAVATAAAEYVRAA